MNPIKGQGELTLSDGRKLKLQFDMNAIIDAGSLLKVNMLEKLSDADFMRDLETQRALIWAALQEHHPEIGLREAGRIMVEAAEEFAKVVTESMPQDEADGGEEVEEPSEPGPRLVAGASTIS